MHSLLVIYYSFIASILFSISWTVHTFSLNNICKKLIDAECSSIEQSVKGKPLAPPLEKLVQEAFKNKVAREVRIVAINKPDSQVIAAVGFGLACLFFNGPVYLFVNEALLSKFTPQEQLFILYHELNHIKYNHHAQTLALIFAASLSSAYNGYSAFKAYNPSISNKYMHFAMRLVAGALSGYVTQKVHNLWLFWFMRQHEFQADQEVLIMQKSLKAACSALEKRKLLVPRKFQILDWLFNDHPSEDERIDNILKTAFVNGIDLTLLMSREFAQKAVRF